MFTKRTIREYDIEGKRVLLRVDYNLPALEDGAPSDEYRIVQSLDTLRYLLEKNCSIVIMSHRGRPKPGEHLPATSLLSVSQSLSRHLEKDVQFADDCIGAQAQTLAEHLEPGQILMLENVRYYEQDEANDEEFARKLVEVSKAEVFVSDCFGVAHRDQASVTGVAKLLPAISGLLLEREVDTITRVMESPERPLMVVVGGAKISDKIEILERFIEVADIVVVVGALANTFLLAEGHKVGSSLAEPNDISVAQRVIDRAREKSQNQRFTFVIPKDVVVAKDMVNTSPTRIVDISNHSWADIVSYPKKPERQLFEVAEDEKILDIGPFTASYIAGIVTQARTVIWNGTCGVTEVKGLSGAQDPFGHATKIVVQALVGAPGSHDKPFVVVGGGDTVAYVESIHGLREQLGHVSTGGGASLELMSGKQLPGVEVLWNKEG
jgi:phosphoglycerate kinase